MAKLSSNTAVATSAVSGLKGIGRVSKGGTVNLSFSNISAMKKGTEVNNQLADSVNDLVDCVKDQADKFISLAQAIESRDSRDLRS